MNERIVIRHMSGGKPTSTEEFPVAGNREFTAGREPDCKIKFDIDKEDLVSRHHARITIEKTDPVQAAIVDLGSTNGTFVNRQRIFTSVPLHPGDLIQMGPGGPEFQFDVEPKVAKPTRMAEAPLPVPAAAPTRQASILPPSMPAKTASGPPVQTTGSVWTVGKATVERMISQGRTKTRNQMLWGGFALLLVILGVGAYLLTRPKPSIYINNSSNNGTLSSADIAARSTNAVVYIEVAWSLIDSSNGRTLSQVYFANSQKDKNGKQTPLIAGAGNTLPVFIALKGDVEPVLSTDDGGGAYVPISESGSGSGFVVDSSGFILTNRHVASGWDTSYGGWSYHGDKAGILLTPTDKGFDASTIGAESFPARWVPSQAKIIVEGKLSPANFKVVRDNLGFAHTVQGRNDVLNITLAKSRIRTAGMVTKVSDHADVALLKIETPQPLTKVELNDNYDSVQPGAMVTVMGYPGVSPQIVQAAASSDVFNSATTEATIPNPTVTSGNIGQILRNGANNTTEQATFSTFGDYYQLAINTTGSGNSGGPVFDDQGRVIGIFTATRTAANASVTFALPIRFGMELMK